MKLVLFENAGDSEPRPGLMTERGIVDISGHVAQSYTPQLTMQGIIDDFERLRPVLDGLAASGEAKPVASVRLRPPLPRPGKILCCIGNYWEHAQREPRPLNMFMKNPEGVIGPGDTIMLPKLTEPWIFTHEAELALVIKGPAKEVRREDWRQAVFGYTGLTCRPAAKAGAPGRPAAGSANPSIPSRRSARASRRPTRSPTPTTSSSASYNTDDMEHRVPELVEFASGIMTLNSGDLIACGTNHEGLGALQDGERVEIEVQHVGRMALDVADPLKRQWEKGVYMGADSTNPEAVKRHRPQGAG
jgi:2-keto-4-pentenoate hydratase/2-oxohepta-3-ene-1,7-dioic acid hydratase in catechol pathway